MFTPEKILQHVQQHNGHGEGETNYIVHHLADANYLDFFGYEVHLPHLHLFGLDLSITKHVVMIWLAAVLVSFTFIWMSRKRKKEDVPSGFANLLETIVIFVRDDIVYENFGETGKKFVPFFLTTFFFILTCNLLGMVPTAATTTSNISVTGALACISLITIVLSGSIANGPIKYLKSLIPSGVPILLMPLMAVIELMGLFAKPFALAVRLFANMTAGHAVILGILGLVIQFKSYIIAPFPILMVIGISLLEIFVAFLQAYIFTFLTAIFVSSAVHPHH